MTTRYLLPCSCGKEIPVEPRQAGQVIECTCGASVEVPTMLEMAALGQAEPEPIPPQPPAAWGIRQGLVLLGAVATSGALLLGAVLLWSRPVPPSARRDPDVIRRYIRSLAPLPSWRTWQALRAAGLGRGNEIQEEVYQEKLFRWRLAMGVILIIGAVGIGLIVVPLLTRPRRDGNCKLPTIYS